MKRVEIQRFQNKSIILVDLSNLQGKELIDVLTEAKKVIGASKEKSALIMTDVTNARYDKEVGEAIKNFSKFNTPYVKASTVVGAQGIQLILMQTTAFITRREFKTHDTRKEASTWLLAQ